MTDEQTVHYLTLASAFPLEFDVQRACAAAMVRNEQDRESVLVEIGEAVGEHADALVEAFDQRHAEAVQALARMLHATLRDLTDRGLNGDPLESAMLSEMGAACCRKFGIAPNALRAALCDLEAMDALH